MDIVNGRDYNSGLTEFLASIGHRFNNIDSNIFYLAKKSIKITGMAALCSVSSIFTQVQYPMLMIPVVVLVFDTEAKEKIRGVVCSILTSFDQANCDIIPGSSME